MFFNKHKLSDREQLMRMSMLYEHLNLRVARLQNQVEYLEKENEELRGYYEKACKNSDHINIILSDRRHMCKGNGTHRTRTRRRNRKRVLTNYEKGVDNMT